jgi:hypothetical protein
LPIEVANCVHRTWNTTRPRSTPVERLSELIEELNALNSASLSVRRLRQNRQVPRTTPKKSDLLTMGTSPP